MSVPESKSGKTLKSALSFRTSSEHGVVEVRADQEFGVRIFLS